MEQDKAGEKYWNSVWNEKIVIDEIDINYYTNRLLHNLYQKYFQFNKYFGYQINGFDYEIEV